MNVFFFGLGYSSQASAKAMRELISPDLTVSGTARTREKAEALLRQKLRVHAFDGRAPGLMLANDLSRATHVVMSIPPKDGEDVVLAHHRRELATSDSLEWLCYYSTVGVYPDAKGAWIDETETGTPTSQRGQERLRVEQQWRDFAAEKNVPLTIFRIAGIYGPDRSTFDKLRAKTAHRIIKPGQVFNRIHVDDIARFTALAAHNKLDGTFNLADDEPAPPQDVVTYAAEMSGLTAPDQVPFEEAELSDMARSFYADCKRVSNAAIKKALHVELRHPTYRDGLGAIFDQEVRS